MRVRPVPAAWMERTAARRSRLFWKSFTRACRALVFTLPSMRMYLVFVLHQMHHLDDAGIDARFAFVREQAPAGFLA